MKLSSIPSLLLAGLISLTACQPTQLPPEALASYVADPAHQLCQVQHVGGTEVRVTYQPPDLLVARSLPETSYRQATVDSLRKQYRDGAFFMFSIARNQREVLQPTEGFADYSALLQTLAFRMGEHVRLLTSRGDTLRPVNYYLDRTYASASATQLLFAFAKPPTTGDWRFQLRECGLGTGNLSFSFDAARLAAAPTLALD